MFILIGGVLGAVLVYFVVWPAVLAGIDAGESKSPLARILGTIPFALIGLVAWAPFGTIFYIFNKPERPIGFVEQSSSFAIGATGFWCFLFVPLLVWGGMIYLAYTER